MIEYVKPRVMVPGLIGGGIAAFIDVAYVVIVESQRPGPPVALLAVVAGALLVASTLAVVGSLVPDGRVLLTIATVLLMILGFLAILSIGVPLLLAGMLTLVASTQVTYRPTYERVTASGPGPGPGPTTPPPCD
jgi:hypothetical protein